MKRYIVTHCLVLYIQCTVMFRYWQWQAKNIFSRKIWFPKDRLSVTGVKNLEKTFETLDRNKVRK